MKKSTLQKRIEKSGLNNRKALELCKELAGMIRKDGRPYISGMISGGMIRPCYTSGHGRFIINQDHMAAVCMYFDRLGLKYETGNDAPRGGKTGQYIKIITKITE